MGPRQIKRHYQLTEESQKLIRVAMTELNLSACAYDRILKVSRTVADLASSDAIAPEHVSETIQYRTFDRTHWVCARARRTVAAATVGARSTEPGSLQSRSPDADSC
jgi:Magnesium chelatase, subunit ChlI C-terminal